MVDVLYKRSRRSPERQTISVPLFLALVLLALAPAAFSQGVIDDNLAPPPLKILSQDEKNRLAAETEVKRRTKLALELMDVRLKQAEARDAESNYDETFVQLGAFHGLMDNTMEFLTKSDKDDRKVIVNFKRFEIGLRAFTPRLEMIRHELPIRYEQYVKNLIRNLRATRAKAIEPLFDDTVLPDKKPSSGDEQ